MRATESLLRSRAEMERCGVPRYFFNVMDGRSMPDLDGTLLADAAAARREAIRLCAGILYDAPDAVSDGELWRMEVLDEARDVLFTLSFGLREARPL